MRVLLLGATDSLGSRLVPAFLSHSHVLTIPVRNPKKLQSLLPHPMGSASNSHFKTEIGTAADIPNLIRIFRIVTSKPLSQQLEPVSTKILTPEEHMEMQGSRMPLDRTADIPPKWKASSFKPLPGFGEYWEVLSNASRYAVKLEDVAELVAHELGKPEESFNGKRIGILERR